MKPSWTALRPCLRAPRNSGGSRLAVVCALLALALVALLAHGIWSGGAGYRDLQALVRGWLAPKPAPTPTAPDAPAALPAPTVESAADSAPRVPATPIPMVFTNPPPPASRPAAPAAQPMRFLAISQMNHDPSTWRFQITTTNGQTRIVKIGERVDGWTLKTGTSRAVVLEKGGQRVRLAKEAAPDATASAK